MNEPLVLAIDQGTSSTKAILVDANGEIRGRSSIPVARRYPRPGWVEQDPLELWESVLEAIDALPELVGRVTAIGVTNQRESIVVWDRSTGRPLAPSIGWQCRRGAELCQELTALGHGPNVRHLTGLPLDPSFSAPKLRWLLDSDSRLRAMAEEGQLCAGTVDSWLVWNLTGGKTHATDLGNASRTLLFDIDRLEWSGELLKLFGIPRACLPSPRPSCGAIGEAVSIRRLPVLPVSAVIADSHAALYGLGCLGPGSAKATFGTGTSLMTPTAQVVTQSSHGLASTIAWSGKQTTYALEGNILSTGATVRWLADLLEIDEAAVEALADSAATTGGVYLVPAFAGLAAPHWDPTARARIEGLTFAAGRAELARAAVESIAFQVVDLIDAAEFDLGQPLEALRIDGGASRNDGLVQILADLLARPVLRSVSADAAALGAAYMAGLEVGIWDEEAIDRLPRSFDTFEPRTDQSRLERLAEWRGALDHARSRELATSRREIEASPT